MIVTELEVKETIFKLLSNIAPEADLENLDWHESWMDALDIDFLDFVNFIVDLQEQLGIDIPEADYGQVGSISQLLSYVTAKVSEDPIDT